MDFYSGLCLQSHELVDPASTRQLFEEDYNSIILAHHGFLVFRLNESITKLTGVDLKRQSMLRRKFLKFIYCLWLQAIPRLDPTNPRLITNVESCADEDYLYQLMLEHFGICVSHCIFFDILQLGCPELQSNAKLPTSYGKFVLFSIITNHSS